MISPAAPFVWSVFNDLKDVKKTRCYINGHQFVFLDLTVYYDDGRDVEYKKKYRQEFFKYCKQLFYVVLGPNDYNERDVFDVDVDIFNAMGQTDPENTNNVYNKVYADEANTKYGFDWKSLASEIGFKKTPEFFITSSICPGARALARITLIWLSVITFYLHLNYINLRSADNPYLRRRL
jgi:hypothetical protein